MLLSNGDATFEAARNFYVGYSPFEPRVADVNADGVPDAIVAVQGGNAAFLLGNGDGTFATASHFGAGGNPESHVVGDFNRDGKLDVVVSNRRSDSISILMHR